MREGEGDKMDTITIKRLKLSMSESALRELQLRSKRLRECAYNEPCKVCIHSAWSHP